MFSIAHLTRRLVAMGGIVIVLFVVACQPDDNGVVPSKGVFYGDVVLFDQYSDSITDRSGATIEAISSSGTVHQTLTDAAGSWRIENIPTEVYEVKITHPDYDTNLWGSAHSLKNLTHGGAGAQFVGRFSMAKVAEMDLIRVIDASTVWSYDSTLHPGGYHVDSTVKLIVKLESKLSKSESAAKYVLALTGTPDATCGEEFDRLPRGFIRTDNIVEFDLSKSYGRLRDNAKRTADGKTFYLQIRRDYDPLDPRTYQKTGKCLPPFVVTLTL